MTTRSDPVECARGHGDLNAPPYHIVRCAHLGDLFVMEGGRNYPSGGYHYVDYVQDLPDGRVVVEHFVCWSDLVLPPEITQEWDNFHARMLAGDGPRWEK